MGDFRFVPNGSGFVRLRNSGPVQQACLKAVQGIAAAARHGKYAYRTDVRPGRTRCHAMVVWDPNEARAEMGDRAYFSAMRSDPAKKALEAAARGGSR